MFNDEIFTKVSELPIWSNLFMIDGDKNMVKNTILWSEIAILDTHNSDHYCSGIYAIITQYSP